MRRHSWLSLVVLLELAAAASPAAAQPTPWELDPDATPRYPETIAWCRALAGSQDRIAYTSFGTSPQGRELPLVIWDRDGLADPGSCREAGRLVLLVQACIHAGESCGKDAGMTLMRDLCADGPSGITVLFIPIFNVDGHERFGPYGRINQNGPREMGWRTTAANLNLNRDYYKADTPEMQAWLRLWNAWQPHFLIDVHATDGADYQYALTYGLELAGSLDPGLTAWLERYLAAVQPAMAEAGLPIAPYVSFREWHDPRSGVDSWVATPRFSQGYAAVRNRPALLIEAHMLKPYPVRVAATRALLDHTLAYLADHRGELRELTAGADRRAASAGFRDAPYPVRWAKTDASQDFRFLGVAYEETTSALSGGKYFVYHPERPDTFVVPFYNRPAVAAAVALPEAYLVPPEWEAVVERLSLHGAAVRRLREPVQLTVRTWRFREPVWEPRPFEGRHPVDFALEPLTVSWLFPAGTAVVDLAQPAAPAIAHGLEPEAPDSFARWGFFDSAMTQVEYVESYVIERMMSRMVADNPSLIDSLAARKAADPEFAGDPWAIRTWFYRRTPYYDQRAFVYPIGCLDDRGAVDALPLAAPPASVEDAGR
ncbi:MAG TPA: M14 family metallopeptidase [Candidatus Krumholzibacteria bacterium]|nr:M14 family metallopeptidase [Candidatus Krumholzibacteria bacterium]HPD70484.1 M14 family metallopeptidase [Candidatus Krumholzibacteria bacterium]HRY39816.1 M14 family metallopeptidase [Candidatus Krumholzibacteria bacterium]